MRSPMFQSRNRGSFDFKVRCVLTMPRQFKFQSRNRGSFDFKEMMPRWKQSPSSTFQSRNRGSFDFKRRKNITTIQRLSGFNLVIEVLLISRKTTYRHQYRPRLLNVQFQSRNRGSFDFKPSQYPKHQPPYVRVSIS